MQIQVKIEGLTNDGKKMWFWQSFNYNPEFLDWSMEDRDESIRRFQHSFNPPVKITAYKYPIQRWATRTLTKKKK